MNITTTTENIKQTDEAGIQVFDFGNVSSNSEAITTVRFKGVNVSEFGIRSTCSCTAGTPVQIDSSTVDVQVQYKNTHKLQPFATVLDWWGKENQAQKKGRIKIKGRVV